MLPDKMADPSNKLALCSASRYSYVHGITVLDFSVTSALCGLPFFMVTRKNGGRAGRGRQIC